MMQCISHFLFVWEEWPNGLRRDNKNRNINDTNPLGPRLGLETEPRCEALDDLWAEIVKNEVINIGWVWLCPLNNGESWSWDSQI